MNIFLLVASRFISSNSIARVIRSKAHLSLFAQLSHHSIETLRLRISTRSPAWPIGFLSPECQWKGFPLPGSISRSIIALEIRKTTPCRMINSGCCTECVRHLALPTLADSRLMKSSFSRMSMSAGGKGSHRPSSNKDPTHKHGQSARLMELQIRERQATLTWGNRTNPSIRADLHGAGSRLGSMTGEQTEEPRKNRTVLSTKFQTVPTP